MDLDFGSYHEIIELLVPWLEEYAQILSVEKKVGVIYFSKPNAVNCWPNLNRSEFVVEIYYPSERIADLDIDADQWQVRFLTISGDNCSHNKKIFNLSDPKSFQQMAQVVQNLVK